MRLFISGSAPLAAQTFAKFETRTGHRILERYGMSETLMSTSNPLAGERIGGTVGFALPGIEARIADDARVLANGEIGEIEVRGPNVFRGYWRMPDKTAEEFSGDGFFRTGDLGTMDAEGRVSIVGRARDLVISGGYNVYPKEVETLIDDMPEVSESAVIGVPHPDFGEGVVAVGRAARRAGGHRDGGCRSQGQAGAVQATEARGLRGRPAAQRHGQGAEERIARALRPPVCVECARGRGLRFALQHFREAASMKTTLMITIAVLMASTLRAGEIPVAAPESVGMSAEALERLTAASQEFVDEGQFPGVLTMVAREGRIVHVSAVGQRGLEDDRPLTEDALFRIYSMTKPITAVAAMMLHEEGAFRLDDPVARFLPELRELEVLGEDGKPGAGGERDDRAATADAYGGVLLRL